MQNKIWRYGYRLESIDLVKELFKKIHDRNLSTKRGNQIVASFLQGMEYYKNASVANLYVKPLLLFYGVSSLSKCLSLLLNPYNGEEALNSGHGLIAKGWRSLLTDDVSEGLKKIGGLKVTSAEGLFTDLIHATKNISRLHVSSAGVDYSIKYDQHELPADLTLGEVCSRIPDLRSEYKLWTGNDSLNVPVNSLSSKDDLFELKVHKSFDVEKIFLPLEDGLSLKKEKDFIVLSGDGKRIPMLINTFVSKTFDKIPSLYASKHLDNFGEISQIPLSFCLAYFLGMLCRYFPTHWMGLSRGINGDSIWPMIQISMTYIEEAYPEIIFEYLREAERKGLNL